MSDLSRTFLEAASAPVRQRLAVEPMLEARLAAALVTARAEWPTVEVPDAEALAFIATHLPDDATLETLDALSVGDLRLACGCARGDASALAVFDAEFLPRLRAVLRRQGASDLQVEEVVSSLSERLLVAGPSGPRIASYSGRGRLAQWLKASAVRALIDVRRTEHPGEPDGDDWVTALPADRASPELTALQQQHQAAFTEALRDALSSLSDRERTLLRLHTVERSTIDDLGALYQVHRVTAFRWVEAARQKLIERTRERLKAHWRADTEELQSLMRGMASLVEVSLRTALR